MVNVLYNKASGVVEVGKKCKVLTLHILEEELSRVQEMLGITAEPLRQEAKDLMKIEYMNMPEYRNEEKPIETNPCYKVMFPTEKDMELFNKVMNTKVKKTTRSLWFPHRPVHSLTGMMYVTDTPVQTKYPIYILSKGRYNTNFTAKTLDEMKVDYKMVVEPQEFELYAEQVSRDKLIILPDEYLNKDQGGIPARNFIWQHSIDNGHKAHWVLDDNIRGFFRWNKNKKLPLKSGICFKLIEDYYDACDNVAQCGIQYYSFYPEISLKRPMFLKNTRVYSCILQRNDVNLPERWRGKYNEDTDLSLRLLKAGWGTLLFQNFQCGKQTTLSVKGGNQKIYSGDGLQKKLDSLIAQHPDVVKPTKKFKKVHHQVNYKPFRKNLIERKTTTFPTYPEIKLVKNSKKTSEDEEDEEDESDEDEEDESS
jgi:hypothetical protein